MTHVTLSANAKLGNLVDFHGKFVITANHGPAFIAKNKFPETPLHAYQLLIGENKKFELVRWPTDQLSDSEYAVEVVHDLLTIEKTKGGDLIQIHQAQAGDLLVTSEARILVGFHKNAGFPKFVDIDSGTASTGGNGYALRLSQWEIVGYNDKVEVFRIKKPSAGFLDT